jgi:oligopeptide transport system substrate-binding protein
VRQAFSFAIDRNLISKIRSKGDTPNNTLIPPELGQYLDYNELTNKFTKDFGDKFDSNGYHPDLARKILAKAGYPNGTNFPEVEFLIPNRDDAKLLAEAMQALWEKELNVNVKINAMEWKNFLTQLRDDPPHLFRLNWGADYPDPDTFMQLFSSRNQINYGHWSNSHYDSLIKAAAASNNMSIRKKLYSEAEYLISQDEVGIIPLYIDSQLIFKRKYVSGLRVNPMDIVFLDKINLVE